MTEHDLLELLREKHPHKEWAFAAHVRNGTGWTKRVTRTADALALSLWPSRGLELHGFEVKCSRSDWKRELEDPAKAEEIAGYCDRWWIVVSDDKVVRAGELPPAWGLLVAREGKLVVVTPAPLLPEAARKPLDRSFIAAFARALSDADAEAAERRAATANRKQIADLHAAHAKQVERMRLDLVREREESKRLGDELLAAQGNKPAVDHARHSLQWVANSARSALRAAEEGLAALAPPAAPRLPDADPLPEGD